jgi:hypothetical protein
MNVVQQHIVAPCQFGIEASATLRNAACILNLPIPH